MNLIMLASKMSASCVVSGFPVKRVVQVAVAAQLALGHTAAMEKKDVRVQLVISPSEMGGA